MARFSYKDADKFGASKNDYFSLKNDKDTAQVKFLYNTIDDVQGVSIHEIEVDGKRIDVECLTDPDNPNSVCPLCEAGYKVGTKIYVPVFDLRSKESKIWTRGKSFFSKLSSLCARYNPLVQQIFEIERAGKPGDRETTYEVFPMGTLDNSRLEDYEINQPDGKCLFTKTVADMDYYLDHGRFPATQNTNNNNFQNGRTVNLNNNQVNTPAEPVRRRPPVSNTEEF